MKVEAPEIRVLIEAEARERVNHWVRMAQGEVSGLGLVEQTEDGFLITQVFLPVQECGGASTDIEPEAVAQVMIDAERSSLDSAQLKFWWHSHAEMRCFWSITDAQTISRFKPEDYFVSMVVNKAGLHLTRVDYYRPFRLTFLDVRTDVKFPDLGLQEKCEKLFHERVSENVDFPCSDLIDLGADLSKVEIINKLETGELDWDEANQLLDDRGSEPGESDWRWRDDF